MQKLLVSTFVLALSAHAPAQTVTYETSPPGHVVKFNADLYWYLGQFANGHFQQGDGELMKRMAISRMDYRLDPSVDYRPGPARKWSNVRLRLGETKLPLSTTFASNYVTTPQTVFNSKMTWRPPVGAFPTPPANTQITPWGGHGLAFPFSSVFIYSGTKPMLREYFFTGGTLANGKPWSGWRVFHLDGIYNHSDVVKRYQFASGHFLYNIACNDSSITKTHGSYAALVWTNYDRTYSVTTLAGKTSVAMWSYYTAPQKTVVQALGTPRILPLNIGATCNLLYIDSLLFFFVTANTAGYARHPSTGFLVFPHITSTFNTRAGIQAAWVDSKTGRFSLTGAYLPTLPALPLQRLLGKETVYRSSLTATTGFRVTDHADCPRFTFK